MRHCLTSAEPLPEHTVDQIKKADRLDDFQRLCREAGLPFTVQRRVILEAALELETHPTADDIHQRVVERHPGIARATVYRTLEELCRRGLLTKACHPGRVVRYDSRTEPHHHLVCLHCDSMIDISDAAIERVPIPDTSAFGFEVRDFRVQLRGICRRCRQLEEKS